MKKVFPIILLTLILLGIGVFTMFSLSSEESRMLMNNIAKSGSSFVVDKDFYFFRHLWNVITSIAIGIGMFLISKKYLKTSKFAIGFFVVSLVFMIMSLVPGIGVSINGTSGRISLFGLTFIPVYFYIIGIVFLFSNILGRKLSLPNQIKIVTKRLSLQAEMPSFVSKIPEYIVYLLVQILVSIPVLLIKDISNFVLVRLIGILLYFFSKQVGKLKYLIVVLSLFVAGFFLLSWSNRGHIIAVRLECSILHNSREANDLCWSQNKSKIAVNRGGFLGVGFTKGILNKKVPNVMSDFNFAGIGEEFGKLGFFFIIFLYSALFRFILKDSKKNLKLNDNKELVVLGLCSYLLLITLFHILVNLSFLPFVSFNLAFISYAGTGLMSQVMAIGLIGKMRC